MHRIRNAALLSAACTNCVKTVHLIDEFRNLCQYNRNFERAAFGEQEEDVCGGSGYLPETVFVKGQQGPAEVGFEWEDVEEMVVIKQEVVGSNDDDEVEEGMEEVVGSDDDSAPSQLGGGSTYAGQSNSGAVESWVECKAGWSPAVVPGRSYLDSTGRRNGTATGSASKTFTTSGGGFSKPGNHQCLQDPFFLLLEKMWIKNSRPAYPRQPVPTRTTANISPEEVEPLHANNHMQLTQLIYDREVIWNRTHPDHPVLHKRDEAFDEVARELGMLDWATDRKIWT
ncbi:hypothetical protein quinque_007580 [Culex quinquefasciatus]